MRPVIKVRHRIHLIQSSYRCKSGLPYRYFNYLNKLQFGELLETSVQRSRRLKQSETLGRNAETTTNIDKKSTTKEKSKIKRTNKEKLEDVKKLPTRKSNLVAKVKRESKIAAIASSQIDSELHSRTSRTTKDANKLETFPSNDLKLSFPLYNLEKPKYAPNSLYVPSKATVNFCYPSVSTILSETLSERSRLNLKRWRDEMIAKMGEEEFEKYSQNQMQLSIRLRAQIMHILTTGSVSSIDDEMLPFYNSLRNVFPLFKNIKEIDRGVTHQKLLYCGKIDCIVDFRDKLTLVIWKKSNKFVPTLEKTYDTPIQIAAYIGAINYDPNIPFTVEDALLVMYYPDGSKADIFHMDAAICSKYWLLWFERLSVFHNTSRSRQIDLTQNTFSEDISAKKLDLDEKLEKAEEVTVDSTTSLKISEENIHKVGQISKTEKDTSIVMNEEKITQQSVEGEISSPSDSSTPVIHQFVVEDDKLNGIEIEYANESFINFPLYNNEKRVFSVDEKYTIVGSNQETFKLCPAVTTILNETKSNMAKLILERWKRNMINQLGEEGFEKYQQDLFTTGKLFHKLLQEFLLNREFNLDIPTELEGCWRSVQPVLSMISHVELTECKVVHEILKYKGIVDCVALFKDKLVLIDWKKSDKPKTAISMTYDAPLQIAAYIGAMNYDSNYPFKIEEGLLVVCYVDGTKADIFHLDKVQCTKYWRLWSKRYHLFQEQVKNNDSRIKY